MKRTFDVVFSFLGLVILSPILLIVSIIIRKEDRGPVIYKSKRTGLSGRPFTMFKFRTMIVDADKAGPGSTSDSDIRITRIGRILRKYKIDEIPQLFNVLTGQMSFVGPRPEIKKFTDLYTDEEKLILSVKPGITDWASIWNSDEGKILDGSLDPDKVYLELIRPEKIRLQLEYVKYNNFFIDLKIIFLTLKKIIIKR